MRLSPREQSLLPRQRLNMNDNGLTRHRGAFDAHNYHFLRRRTKARYVSLLVICLVGFMGIKGYRKYSMKTYLRNSRLYPEKKLFIRSIWETAIPVFTNRMVDAKNEDLHRLSAMLFASSNLQVEHMVMDSKQRRQFLTDYGPTCYKGSDTGKNYVMERYDGLSFDRQRVELWKYCALFVYGGAYIDGDNALIHTFGDIFYNADYANKNTNLGVFSGQNFAVLNPAVPNTIHESVLALNEKHSPVAKAMVTFLVETTNDELRKSPLSLSSELYRLIQGQVFIDGSDDSSMHPGALPPAKGQEYQWVLFEQQCSSNPFVPAGGKDQAAQDEVISSRKWYVVHIFDLVENSL